jgi:hypothetical protein
MTIALDSDDDNGGNLFSGIVLQRCRERADDDDDKALVGTLVLFFFS